MAGDDGTSERPSLRVVRGEPDDVELAALAAVLTTASARPDGERKRSGPRSRWSDPAVRLRQPQRPGPDAWRMSMRPG